MPLDLSGLYGVLDLYINLIYLHISDNDKYIINCKNYIYFRAFICVSNSGNDILIHSKPLIDISFSQINPAI